MNLEGLGEALVDQLVTAGLVRDYADMYSPQADVVARLERQGKKSAANLIAEIDKSRTSELSRLLYALGIRHVGEGGARALARAFRSVAALEAAPLEQLEAVQDVGPVVARSVRTFLDESHNVDLLARLGAAGVRLEETVKEGDDSAGPPVLAGQTYVITGTLESMSREDAAEALERLGAKVTSSISRKTSGIVVGKEPGSKLEKARTIGVPQFDED